MKSNNEPDIEPENKPDKLLTIQWNVKIEEQDEVTFTQDQH